MKFPSLIYLGLATTLFANSLPAFAIQPPSPNNELVIQKDKVYDPNVLSMDSIQAYEKKFDLDCNNYTTIAPNKQKIEEIESFLQTHPNYSAMSRADKQAFGKMLYKLGTYYIDIARKPDVAIARMNLANSFLINKTDKAWNDNHLAYAYDIKYIASEDEKDEQKALSYVNKVIALYHNANNPEVAFAYCVKGQIENEAKNYSEAENSFKHALDIYEKLPTGKDDQYARAKNGLATTILAQNGRDEEALDILQDLQKYWNAKRDVKENPYAASNTLALAQAEFKIGKTEEARDDVKKVIPIFESLYGKDSEQLVEPYQLLADTYKQLGDQKLADAYQIKANELDNSGV